MLMGVAINQRPELFHGVIAQVPFVDGVTTRREESIPLTTGEFEEWGNPQDPQYYEYMKSYSPYDNVTAQAYPHLLVTTGLHDSQVQYWEPGKKDENNGRISAWRQKNRCMGKCFCIRYVIFFGSYFCRLCGTAWLEHRFGQYLDRHR